MYSFNVDTLFARRLSNILMFYFVIVVIKLVAMSSAHFEAFPDNEYPAPELNIRNVMEHLSVKFIYEKAEVRDNSVRTNPTINDCETEDYADLGEIELEREEKVRKLNMEFLFHHETFE